MKSLLLQICLCHVREIGFSINEMADVFLDLDQ